MVPPSTPLVVSTGATPPSTVILSDCAPGSKTRSILYSLPTSTTIFARSVALNPGYCAFTIYVPGVSSGALYAPASSVVSVRVVPRCVSITEMVAPETIPPLKSVTAPVILPVLPPCEKAGTEAKHKAMPTHAHFTRMKCIDSPYSGSEIITDGRGRQAASGQTAPRPHGPGLKPCP